MSDPTRSKSVEPPAAVDPKSVQDASTASAVNRPVEHGGPKGPEPTRYGDWERNGKCVDF